MEQAEDCFRIEALGLIPRLRLRSERDATGLHYVEGIRQVFCALDRRVRVERLVYCERLAPAFVQKRVRMARREGVPVLRVGPEEFRRASAASRVSGIGAILHQHWLPLHDANPNRGLCWIAIGRIRFPGNLGTVIRTAEAAGVGGLIVLDRTADPFDERTVRASMGGIFGLRLARACQRDLSVWAARHNCSIVGTSPTGEISYTEISPAGPLVLVLGEERKGLTAAQLHMCEQTARIPMAGRIADSLNIGVAAGVVLFDLARRRMEVA